MEQQPAPKRNGAPLGNQRAYLHGHFTREAKAERKRARAARDAARCPAAVPSDQAGQEA